MAERFNCYIHTPATRATGREIRPDGEFVLASDYAKLEAENAELRATMANDKPAASPWRYDVENAPMDVRLLASWGGDVFEPAEYNKNKAGYLVWAVNDMLVPAPIAFATINQPEMPND